VEQYKRLRGLVQHGDLYRLGAPEAECGFHYVSEDGSKAVAYLFQIASRFGEEPVFQFPGLRVEQRYNVTLQGAHVGDKPKLLGTFSGEALAKRGLKVPLKGAFKSAVLEIEPAK
jgi:alpha-galactosidase